MKQAVQSISGGPVRVVDVPRPVIGPTEVLVQTMTSVLSPGTERAVTALAQSNLLAKAKARPDLVRQVIDKARSEGWAQTARKVRARLDGDVPLGYSAVGVAIEVGGFVDGISPGQVVATGGAGRANHAEYQSVPGLLCCPVPNGVAPEDAAFATIGAIALHGLRLAELGPGSRVVVIGLGLVGQLAVRLAHAAGHSVAAIDVAEFPVGRARAAGALALVEAGDDTTEAVLAWSRGRGADAVLVTASGSSSAVVRRTPALCRDRAAVVVVGDVGLELERTPLYEKELVLRFARSYGPGRYERSYEEWGVDYPPGFVRWTEGRNQEAVLDLLAAGRLEVADLVTHRFPITDAPAAYALIESRAEPFLGVALTYDPTPSPDTAVRVRPTPPPSKGVPGVGFIGAGAFASGVLLPAFKEAGFTRLISVASASGLSARRLAERGGFEKAVSGAAAVIDDPDVDVVVIATPHDTHGELAARALRSGKHVFCEKPLAITAAELDDVEAAWRESEAVLFVGFNRRYSPAVQVVRQHFEGGSGAIVVTYRVSASPFPDSSWHADPRQGGRVVGETCHFIDTCSTIIGSEVRTVDALGSAGTSMEVIIRLGYTDGSVASITISSGGHPSTEKERIEILGRGRSAEIRDFHTVVLDETRHSRGRQHKGHSEAVRAFHSEIASATTGVVSRSHISSSRATLLAVRRLLMHGA